MTGKWFGLASIFTAFGTSACCVGPVVFSLLGLSSVTSLTLQFNLVPYRNWLLVLSAVFLGGPFYLAYRLGGSPRGFEEVVLWLSAAITALLLLYTLSIEGI